MNFIFQTSWKKIIGELKWIIYIIVFSSLGFKRIKFNKTHMVSTRYKWDLCQKQIV